MSGAFPSLATSSYLSAAPPGPAGPATSRPSPPPSAFHHPFPALTSHHSPAQGAGADEPYNFADVVSLSLDIGPLTGALSFMMKTIHAHSRIFEQIHADYTSLRNEVNAEVKQIRIELSQQTESLQAADDNILQHLRSISEESQVRGVEVENIRNRLNTCDDFMKQCVSEISNVCLQLTTAQEERSQFSAKLENLSSDVDKISMGIIKTIEDVGTASHREINELRGSVLTDLMAFKSDFDFLNTQRAEILDTLTQKADWEQVQSEFTKLSTAFASDMGRVENDVRGVREGVSILRENVVQDLMAIKGETELLHSYRTEMSETLNRKADLAKVVELSGPVTTLSVLHEKILEFDKMFEAIQYRMQSMEKDMMSVKTVGPITVRPMEDCVTEGSPPKRGLETPPHKTFFNYSSPFTGSHGGHSGSHGGSHWSRSATHTQKAATATAPQTAPPVAFGALISQGQGMGFRTSNLGR